MSGILFDHDWSLGILGVLSSRTYQLILFADNAIM